jgi:crossover junction endodeoxyribonuclease RuvC
MVIMGIDPGIATVGFGVISLQKSRTEAIQYGVITTEAGRKLPERLFQIYNDMMRLIDVFAPDAVVVEDLYFNTNVKTAMSVAQGRGVILLAAQKSGVETFECTPLQVKQAVTGYGRAGKKQVADMTRRLLNMEEEAKPDDAADALAIALCHARRCTSAIFEYTNGGKQKGI